MYRMLNLFFILLLLIAPLTGTIHAQITSKFQSEIDTQVASENATGILVTVISKEKQIDWSGASGYVDKDNKVQLSPNQTFRIASVTKTFVAATILRLFEDKRLKLNDPIKKYISIEHSEILKKGGYDPEKITIFHLLTHSSGMAEHTQTEKYAMSYLKTNHFWTRTEQLLDLVNLTKPVGELGQQFAYSDSGYILLGEIIENITGKPLAKAMEEQLRFKKLGLKSIHFEEEKGEFDADRIHQYLDGEDIYFINPTFDLYGGGGLLSSTRDLSLFYQYLFENKVFRKKSTLKQMLEPVKYATQQKLDYRMGIWEAEIGGLKVYTHSGFWGTQVVYIPSLKTSIAVNYSQRWNKKRYAPILEVIIQQLLNEK